MPKLTRDLPLTIGFRATPEDAQKLAALAQQTHRGQGDVLRLLLRQAVLADEPDIQLPRPLLIEEVNESHGG
jgi:hypothetical protein